MSEKEIDLEDLPRVGRITASRLRKAGIKSVRHLALYTAEELEELAGIDPARASTILRAARMAIGFRGEPVSMEELERELESRPRLTTGVQAIDELLGGGLEPGSIYEFAGEFGSGKTQLCHQLAVTVQLTRNKGGVGGKCLYIDTEGTFSPSRIRAIAKRFGLDPAAAAKGVYCARPVNVEYLEDIVRGSLVEFVEEKGVKLVVVDSIIALYRAEFRGREMLARRQQRINYILDWLKRVGRTYSTFIVITNQVLEAPIGFTTIKVPAGGNIIAHASTHRFLLKKAGDVWRLEVLDSPRLPRGKAALFTITDYGVEDAA